MKKYFDFTLTGKKFLPIWLIFYILILLPYGFYLIKMKVLGEPDNLNVFLPLMVIGIMIIGYLIYFYIIKITIEHVKFNNSELEFNGKFLTFLGKVLLGFLLSIVTLFIYLAWFIKDIMGFFVNRSSLDGEKFEFKAKGGTLFLIILLSMFVPIILLTIIFNKQITGINQNFVYSIILQGAMMIIMIPYMYLIYKWMIDIKYKDYHIKWHTNFFKSCGKILIEILLTLITLGIYMPLAYLKLYEYFLERTIAQNDTTSLQFAYELDSKNDFLFIWGQLLLTLVTLGIYYPWAYSKIGKRVLTKTYVTDISVA